MEEDYPFDHAPAKPLRWYHLPIVIPLLGLGKLLDVSRYARCKLLGHLPAYGQYDYCNRCNKMLDDGRLKRPQDR